MRRWQKITAWSVGGLLALILLVIGALLVIGNTNSGRDFIVRMTSRLTQGHVQIAGIHGSFPASLDLDRLQLADDDGIWLFAEAISLRWTPSDLLFRHIKVDSLHVGLLHMERTPLPDKEKKPSKTPSIPRADLASLTIDRLELGKALVGEPASLKVAGTAHLRSLQDMSAQLTAQRTGGNGNYSAQLKFDPTRMDATLEVHEPANGPLENLIKVPGLGELSLLARLNGPRNAEDIELTLDAGPLRGRAQGTINLVQGSADLDYSLAAPAMTPYPGLTWQSIDLKGRFHGPFTTPNADGHLLVKQLQAPGDTRLEALEAKLTADATGLMTLRAAVDGLTIPGPQPTLLQDSRLSLEANIKLNDPERPLQLTANHRLFALQASAVTAGSQSAQLDLRLPDVTPFAALGGQKLRGDVNIKAQIKHTDAATGLLGTAASTSLSADATGKIDGGTAAWAGLIQGGATRLQVTGVLTDKQISIERLQLNARAISLDASGTAERADTQQLNARIDLSLPDLARLSPGIVGSVKLSGKVRGPANSLTADTNLTSTLSIHGSPQGNLQATVHAEGLPKSPHGTVEASGDLDGAPLRLNVSLEHDKADIYHALIKQADWKSAHADGDITSGSDIAQAKGNLHFRMGELSDLNRVLGSALQGSVGGTVALSPVGGKSHAQIQVDAKDVVTGGITTDAQAIGTGTLDALDIELAAQSPAIGGAPATVKATAQLNLSAKQLSVAGLEGTYHDQKLELLAPARLSFAQGFSIEGLKLGAQEAVLQAAGSLSPELNLRASLEQLKPGLINAFVPGLLASGLLSATAEIHGSFAAPTGNVTLDATGVRAANDAARGLPGTDLHAAAELLGNTANVDAKLSAGKASQLSMSGHAPLTADGQWDLKLAGNLDMGLLNPLLEARGRHVTGEVTIDTTVTGVVGDPEIGGTVRLAKGSLRDYTQGVNLSDITGELSGNHGLLRIEKLTARAAPGNVAVAGTIGILQPRIPVDLKITAQDAQPIANNIVTANLNAEMTVKGTAREELEVAGKIQINRANVEIPSGLPPNVAVLDVRRPGKPKPPPPEKPLIINLNITVDAPRQILVKGRGLDAELGGELRIRGTTESPKVGGGFELQRGFFTLASSKLTFSNGNVTFSGAGLKNKIDPNLDFLASSQVLDVTATVRITGLADSPKIELSSVPDLPQDEILARLLFGQPASTLTALQVVQIGAALASLGGGGGGLNPVAKIQKALGLDRLSVGSATTTTATGAQQTSGATFEAGRYVSSRVFVAVKESTTGASQLAVDVDLTKHLKLQTKLGNGNTSAQGTTPENDPGSSVGLAYQFEY
ncbi:MAG: translocation/assembly module TamB domain-containing protein [Proteobacteria bacterium]|nr:translocation/assembly module TamB domain-containing protein [Pseudomonadota bacterium]